jgi:(p)ppGpp synthase/HD superfamily hydrolase
MDLIEKAIEFGKKAHKGQTRWGGEDYFNNHCVVVAQYVSDNMHDLMPRQSWKGWFQPKLWENVIAAAYLHDVLEDTNYTLDTFPILVQEIVKVLTRRKDENYFEYIVRIQNCGPITTACRAIKIADLRCNMKDLKEGSSKDKYRFAEEILTRGLSSMVDDTEYHMRKIFEISGPSAPLRYMRSYYKEEMDKDIYNLLTNLIKKIESK